MASNHRHKRYIQSPISAYFPTQSSIPPASILPNTAAYPSIPPQLESSLLNVGMRVRKAVPEGYKTKPPTQLRPSFSEHAISTAAPSIPSLTRSTSELIPMCGIHKIGGYDVQQWREQVSDAYPRAQADHTLPATCFNFMEEDDFPLPSSQSSDALTLSTDSAPAVPFSQQKVGGVKRGMVDEEEEEEMMEQAFDANLGRVMALPRTRSRTARQTLQRARLIGETLLGPNDDFDEVDFLEQDEPIEFDMS